MQRIFQDSHFTVYQLQLSDGWLIITVMGTITGPIMSTVYTPNGEL